VVNIRTEFSGGKITLRGRGNLAPGFEARDHARLGQTGLESVRKRVSLGIGANDTPMPALAGDRVARISYRDKTGALRTYERRIRSYRTAKAQAGGKPIRDLRSAAKHTRGQHMMDNLSVRWASENQVVIALTTKLARAKALANQKRALWLAWSRRDIAVIMKRAEELFHHQVTQTAAVLHRGGARRRNAQTARTSFNRATAEFAQVAFGRAA
jgi:hypothetical protein